jgi:hypothetical protein
MNPKKINNELSEDNEFSADETELAKRIHKYTSFEHGQVSYDLTKVVLYDDVLAPEQQFTLLLYDYTCNGISTERYSQALTLASILASLAIVKSGLTKSQQISNVLSRCSVLNESDDIKRYMYVLHRHIVKENWVAALSDCLVIVLTMNSVIFEREM